MSYTHVQKKEKKKDKTSPYERHAWNIKIVAPTFSAFAHRFEKWRNHGCNGSRLDGSKLVAL
jgi:hypothetical protein